VLVSKHFYLLACAFLIPIFFIYYLKTMFELIPNLLQEQHMLDTQTCYQFPTCTESFIDDSGFTNITGWDNSTQTCCDICSTPGTASPQTWDYLMLSQSWLPQFCQSLANGFDPTLTHTQNTTCQSDYLAKRDGLGIHGVWPNNYNDYPSCCLQKGEKSVPVLDPVTVSTWPIGNDI